MAHIYDKYHAVSEMSKWCELEDMDYERAYPAYKLVIGPIFPTGIVMSREACHVFKRHLGPARALKHRYEDIVAAELPEYVETLNSNDVLVFLMTLESMN